MDSSCGPSTPLSAFQKHAGVDRSLQQDRLTNSSSASPSFHSQAFRSRETYDHAVDAQFSSFVNDTAGPSANASAESVARDFSRLSVAQREQQAHIRTLMDQENRAKQNIHRQSQYQIQQHQQLQHQQQQQQQLQSASPSSTDMWHQDFMQFLDAPVPSQNQKQIPQQQIFQQPAGSTYMPMYPQMQMPEPIMHNTLSYNADQQQQQALHPAAFEVQQSKVFDDAFDQIERETAVDTAREEVESDADDKDKQVGDDGLSAVAGELLQSLQGNKTQKFKDSTFLALMRRLRDKEVVVQGNRMVESLGDPSVIAERRGEKMGMEGLEAGGEYSPFTAANEMAFEGGQSSFRSGAWEESI
ncbi:uncharacterized protein V2V93DRAFT_367295 [Kockiozyma suomiensis]|uniref:uncharacterized protein n=1 Tax=Kockiozyma suomiensis TaxID=1337062 RepID=UPI0033442D73